MLVAACNNNPEDIAAAAKNTHQSTKSLLENSKGAIRLSDDNVLFLFNFSLLDIHFLLTFSKVIQSNLLEAAKAVANSTAKLVSSAKQQRADAQNPVAQQKLSTASTDVIDTIDQVIVNIII